MSMSYEGGGAFPPRVNYGWIGESWDLLGQQAAPWIASQILYGVLSVGLSLGIAFLFPGSAHAGGSILDRLRGDASPLGDVISAVMSWILTAFQTMAFARMAVKQVRGENITLEDAFRGAPNLGQGMIALLLMSLLAIGGALGLLIGLFFVLGLLLPVLAMVGDGESATGAIAQSIRAMKGDWVNAGLFFLLFTALYAVSMIPCGLGLLATTPMTYLISALAYRDMAGMPGTTQFAGDGQDQAGVWPPSPATPRPPYWGAGQ